MLEAGTHRIEVDGVPVVGVAVAGPVRAGVVFRVGAVDEPAARRGISHLCEHLALAALPRPLHPYNGFTGTRTTGFYAEGTASEVGDHLAAVCRSVSDLSVERFDTERRVLAAEAMGRADRTVVTNLLAWRYGVNGWGGLDLGEVGLPAVTIDELRAWSATWFTSGNATAWVAAPDPTAVLASLPLRAGAARPSPLQAPVLPVFPSWGSANISGPGLGMVAQRSVALGFAMAAVAARAETTLRGERGVVYAVVPTYEPMSGTTVHVHVGADSAPEHRDEVVTGLVGALSEVYGNGPSDDVLARHRRVLENERRPDDAVGWAFNAAGRILDGLEPESIEELDAEARAIDGAAARQALADAWPTALLLVPEGAAPPPAPFVEAPRWSDPVRLDGREFRSATHPGQRIQALGWALCLVMPGGEQVVVRRDRCPLVLWWEDGSRLIHGDDGFRLFVRPDEWEGGRDLVGLIDAFAPPERQVRRGEDTGPSSLVVAPVPSRSPRSSVLWLAVLALFSVVWLISGVSLLVDAQADTGPTDGLISLAFAAAAGLGALVLWRRRSR